MKKLILLLAAGLLSTASYSQKFEAGDCNLEMNFAPLGGAPISINGIRARHFNSSTMAIRLGANLSLANQKNAAGTTADGSINLFTNTSTFNFTLRPGIEKHFAGTERLSPYVGAELDFAIQSHKVETEYEGAANEVETNTVSGTNGYLRFGVNAVCGFDYYFAKKLYLGTEIGFGFGMTNFSDIETENTISGFTAPDPQEQGSTMNFGPNFNGALRLGFCF